MRRALALAALLLTGCAASPAANSGGLPTKVSHAERTALWVTRRVASEVGPDWTIVMDRIAQTESRYQCAPGGNGGGMFQVARPDLFGFTRAQVNTCEGGVTAGIAYLKWCIKQGASNDDQVLRCWNTGDPHATTRRLERSYRALVATKPGAA